MAKAPEMEVRADVAARLPANIAADLAEYLATGKSGQFILNVQKGKILGSRAEHVTKALDSDS